MPNATNLPNRQWELIIVAFVMLILSTTFTAWRIFVRVQGSARLAMSEWLMIVGTAMNICAISTAIVCGFKGAGRLLRDPYWTEDRIIYQNHMTFVSQLLNVYGMYIVKLSICTYLLALNFSVRYRWVIWGTIVFVTIFNFILPATGHFGLCRPLASRWDIRIKEKKCWSQDVRIGIAYTQAISNIITDLVYATAPIVYLRSIQLSVQTQWSVRIVFLMSLLCTAISAMKLVAFQQLQGQKEIYYESVSLSIWSITEISVGIVVANLPPLRKSFDRMLKGILPASIADRIYYGRYTSGSNNQSFQLASYRSQVRGRSTLEAMSNRSTRSRPTEDNESDRAILGSLEKDKDGDGGTIPESSIMKTMQVTVDHEVEDKGGIAPHGIQTVQR